MDYEAQYQMTTEVWNRRSENQDILKSTMSVFPFKVVTCASMFQTLLAPLGRKYARPLGKAYA